MGHMILTGLGIAGVWMAWMGAANAEPVAAIPRAYYQAHRGGLLEVPENTLTAFRHAWACPGAVPETDVRVTKDGILVCMHDDTPARTTNATEPLANTKITDTTFDELRGLDAGVTFSADYAGEKVPALTEVFEEMKGRPERQLYLDLKDIDLDQLGRLIGEYGLGEQILFVHGNPKTCLELTQRFPGARTMTWLSGMPKDIQRRFDALAETGFEGISQIQLHLRTRRTRPEIQYVFDTDYLRYAFEQAKAAGAELQLRPFDFDAQSLQTLLDIGIRWYVADEPKRFAQTLAALKTESRNGKRPTD